MNPQLESIKKQALAINDTLNTKAAAEGKATQTFDAAGRATRVPPSTNIPVAAIENTSPAPVQVPPVSFDPNQSLQSALTASEQVFEGERIRTAEAEDAMKNVETANERRLRELVGLQSRAPEVQLALEDQQGLEQKKRIVNQITAKAGLVADDLDLFKLNTEAVSRQNELEASKRDFTKGTFSAADTRMRTERALEANARASELVGLRAQYAIAEGNVTLANEAVAQAMDIFYKPIEMELELEKKFFDRNTSRMNEAQRSAADVRLKQAEARGAEIRDAKVNVSAAVASGYATAEDVAQMNALSGDPEAQNNYANQIIARGQRQKLAEERAARAASNSATSWTQRAQAYELATLGDPDAIAYLGFDPRATGMDMQEVFDYQNKSMETQKIFDNITEILNNPRGIKASTGISQNVLTESILTGGVLAPVAYVQIGNQKMNVMGALSSLTNTATFQEMRRLKDAGVTFGALTEGERIAIGKAADDLFSAVKVQEDGTVTGINVSEARFRTLLNNYQEQAKRYQSQLDIISGKVNSADEQIIDNLTRVDFGVPLRTGFMSQ